MNTSLPILPGAGAVPKTIQGLADNIHVNQSDIPVEGGFGALFGNIHAALSEPLTPASQGEDIAGELMLELQELPEGGMLLPLLQETLDTAFAQGMDGQQFLDSLTSQGIVGQKFLDMFVYQGEGGQQFLDKLSASLKSLQSAEVGQVAQSLSGLTRQLASLVSAVTGGTSAESVAFSLPGKTDMAAPQSHMTEFIQQQLRPQTTGSQVPNTPDTSVLKQSLTETLPQASQTGLDRALDQLQQQPQAPEGRQSDLAILMAAFRRQHADGAHRTSTEGTRPDLVAVTGGNVASVATGNGPSSSVLPATSVQTPFGHANWGQDMGERVQWMVSQKMQGAQVKLNPANLGPMEVRVQVQNDQASVQFTANNVVVREALEAALPRLRDMFEASGVELVDVDVSGQSFAERQAAGDDADGDGWNGGVIDADSAPEIMLESELTSLGHPGILDLFA